MHLGNTAVVEKFVADLVARHHPVLVPESAVCRCGRDTRFPPVWCSCGAYYGACDVARWGQATGLFPSHTDWPNPWRGSYFFVEAQAEQIESVVRHVLQLHEPKFTALTVCGKCQRPQYERTDCGCCVKRATDCDIAGLARAHELFPPLPELRFLETVGQAVLLEPPVSEQVAKSERHVS